MLKNDELSRQQGEVVVYTSVDDVFARPIAQRLEDETGIAESTTKRGKPVSVSKPESEKEIVRK